MTGINDYYWSLQQERGKKMKFIVTVIIAFALLFSSLGTAGADDLTTLKNQLEELQKKIEELEKKQKEQSKSVDKIKKQPSARDVVSDALGKQVTIGGHLKFFLADQSTGKRNDLDQHDSFSAGVNDLWLYFSKSLSDWMQITVAPQLHVEAGATPSLGSDITRSTGGSVDIDLDEAYMSLRLPYQFELKAGAFYPLFSEEYANKNWWHEQYHANNGLVTLQAWQSTGIEIYRNFDFDQFSLPVYVSFVNDEDRGLIQDSRFTDNNHAMNFLAHAAPEFYTHGSRVRILGSAGLGRWDNDGKNNSNQFAIGADLTKGGLNFSGEYLYRWREDLPLTGGGKENGEDKGWYLRANYTLNPQWRFLIKYSDVDLWAISTDTLLTDNYKTISAAVNFWIAPNSTIIPQIEYVDADRSGGSEKLEYVRYTIGWRTTF